MGGFAGQAGAPQGGGGWSSAGSLAGWGSRDGEASLLEVARAQHEDAVRGLQLHAPHRVAYDVRQPRPRVFILAAVQAQREEPAGQRQVQDHLAVRPPRQPLGHRDLQKERGRVGVEIRGV